jgi:two-component system sensor histidine kinase DegS
VRQLQAHLDSVPPAEICEGYEALLSTRQRMVALRGEMEQLESEQRSLGRLAETQRRVLQLSAAPNSPESGAPSSMINESAIIRLIEDEESSRESLAESMHAGPISSLSNLILQAEICQRFYETSPERARAELASLKKSAAEAFGSVRKALLEVHPLSLAELGLMPAIRRYAELLQEENEPAIGLTVIGDERRLPHHVEIIAFRAALELLNNARTHSEAKQLQLIVDMAADRITIVVEDNGVGFDAGELLSSDNQKRGGLMMLRERADLMGGGLTIQSSAAHGTRAEFSIPAAIQETLPGHS